MSHTPAGLLLVHKPTGLTSHNVVNRVRRVFDLKKVGHAGTLDPLATGVLILLLSREYTKTASQYIGLDKTYVINLDLGWTTDTLDSDGCITHKLPVNSKLLTDLTQAQVLSHLSKLTGVIKQSVPSYSAVKRDGEKLYQKARRGETVDRPVRSVTIHSLNLTKFTPVTQISYPQLTLVTHVSSGTYTRSLVENLGQLLDVPAVQTGLSRTTVGPYTLANCHLLDEIEKHPHPTSLLQT